MEFVNSYFARKHEILEHQHIRAVRCNVCAVEFAGLEAAILHEEITHWVRRDMKESDCMEEALLEEFLQPSYVRFQCPVCHKSYNNLGALIRHEIAYHGKRMSNNS